uniref:F-box protein At4g00893-like n=1 Tax=Erigeron canadensis TaxID=72917 RepID=UPI001CB9A7F5|nr:F-box protein At4g00893-like [Erigeron canadensis]
MSTIKPLSHLLCLLQCCQQAMCRCGKTVDSKHKEDEMAVALITDDMVEVSKSRLHDIPFDVLQMIMKFCVGVEYMNFRATCKRCHPAAPLVQWRSKTELQNYSLVSPWLMVIDKNRGIITFTDPLLGNNYFMKNLQVSIYDDSYCSRFGWLLFKTSEYCLAFFNPFTNDRLELPEADYQFRHVSFSAPPTSTDCMVVGFTKVRVYVHFVSREATWQRINLGDSHPHFVRFPSFYGRDLYGLCDDGELAVFKNLGGEDFSWNPQEIVPCWTRQSHISW